MPDGSVGREGRGNQDGCLVISLHAAASHLRASDGRDIPFTKAVLSVGNSCGGEVSGLVLHATLGQEGGTVQDVTAALAGLPATLRSGENVSLDVYDLLLPAHAGTASKVHMFGYRAALNWRFDLAAWAEYRLPGTSGPSQTPVLRWALRWSVPDPADGAVVLTIGELKGPS